MGTMKAYQRSGFEYFFDTDYRVWTAYPIDESGLRKKFHKNGEACSPILFSSRVEMEAFFKVKEKIV